ncbi:hypothetical protein M0R04_11320 [Candidatus Dojkabacteria bacterium]|jgi:hypothetical protein|nr:hypothetical protein [Candidatus Dojkabacteria bacterium]
MQEIKSNIYNFWIPFIIELYDGKKYIGSIFTNVGEVKEIMEQVRCEYMNFKPFIRGNKKCKK